MIFKIADQPQGALKWTFSEAYPNGSPNVITLSTPSKFFVFNPIKDFTVFGCFDTPGTPKIVTEKFFENPFGNHDHSVWIKWNDKTGEISLEVDGRTKTTY